MKRFGGGGGRNRKGGNCGRVCRELGLVRMTACDWPLLRHMGAGMIKFRLIIWFQIIG